jgi:hypothetical protein
MAMVAALADRNPLEEGVESVIKPVRQLESIYLVSKKLTIKVIVCQGVFGPD